MRRWVVPTIVLLLMLPGNFGRQPARTPELLSSIQERVTALQSSIWRFWACHGLDQTYGGFHGTVGLDGTVVTPTAKGLVQQARHTWAFSTFYQHGHNTVPVSAGVASCGRPHRSPAAAKFSRITGSTKASADAAEATLSLSAQGAAGPDTVAQQEGDILQVPKESAPHTAATATLPPAGSHSVTEATCPGNPHHPDPLPTSRDMASSAYNFVVNHMQDKANNLFHWTVSRDGSTVLQPNKVIYGQWFVLYGLSAYRTAFHDEGAKQLAMSCFKALDAAWHNSTTGGYNEHSSNAIAPDLPDEPLHTDPATPLPRTLNVMMHGLEALTALHRASHDAVVLTRVLEYLEILCIKLQRVDGLLYESYMPGKAGEVWVPAPDEPEMNFTNVVNYGHNLESAWLVADTLDYLLAIKAIKPSLADQYRSAAMAVGKAALHCGYDSSNGGVFEDGLPGTGPRSTAKIWWVQAESMLALWKLYKHSKNDVQYLEKLAATVRFVAEHVNDKHFGEWYWQVQKDGRFDARLYADPLRGTKGNKWKASYHNSRAVLFLEQWMKEDCALYRQNGDAT